MQTLRKVTIQRTWCKNFLYCVMCIQFVFLVNVYALALPHIEHKILETAQGTWSYALSNSGKNALLFIHGASSSKNIWKNQYALALDGYKNIFVDLLGYGKSDKPESGYSLTNWIEGIDAILKQEEIAKVCLVAHSNGVIFAKEYYRAYPGKVSRLMLLDGMLKPMIQKPMLDWMKATLKRSNYEEYMANNVKFMPVQGLLEADAKLLQDDALNVPKRVTMAELELVSDTATWKHMVIQCPVTFVYTNNPMWTEDYFTWLPAIVPDYQLIRWEDTGHFIQLQYPDRLNRLIEDVMHGK